MPTVTNYHWDPVDDCVLMETDHNSSTTVTFTHEPGHFGPLLSENQRGLEYYHHYDTLGSTVFLTNDAGTITDTFQYDGWGDRIARVGSTPTSYQWIGRLGYQTDSGGEYYIRERYYQPVVARWSSADPLWQNAFGDDMRVELNQVHRYSGNNPVNKVDPSGMREVCGGYVRLYTGSWCVEENVYQDALDAAARVLTCWLDCEVTTHQRTITYIGGVVASTAAWAQVERVRYVAKTAEELTKRLGTGVIQERVSLLSRLANLNRGNYFGTVLRYHMRYTKSAPLRSVVRTCAIGVIITETAIGLTCARKCGR